MKKIFLLLSIILITNCSDTTFVNECFNSVNLSGTLTISNPEFIDLQVPGGYTITTLNGRNIIVINRSSSFKAFDLACPEGDCTSSMTFDGLILTCPCSNKEYSSLDGGPQDGDGCTALEYNVLQSSSSTLQISR